MLPNRVSAVLSQTDYDAIMTAIDTINAKLPFLLNINQDDLQTVLRLGDKSRSFVEKAMEVATQNQGFLPRDFDVEEMRKDINLFESLFAVRQALMKLSENVDNTYTVVGSEAYLAALIVYNYAKSSAVGTAGLDGAIDELGKRFARKTKTVKQNDVKN